MKIKNVKYADENHDGVTIRFKDNSTFQIPTQQHRYMYTDVLNEWLEKGNEIEAYQTDEEKLSLEKEHKIQEINELCKVSIEAGFISSALGTEYLYQSELTDQMNLMGAVSTGTTQKVKCSHNEGKAWQWLAHTQEQLNQVLYDAQAYKGLLFEKATTLKEQIKVCTTVEDVQHIRW